MVLKIFKKQKGSNDSKFVDVDSCTENGVVEMLEKWNLFNQVTYKKLHRIGWKGTIKKEADIFAFKSSISLNKKIFYPENPNNWKIPLSYEKEALMFFNKVKKLIKNEAYGQLFMRATLKRLIQ